MAEWYLLRTKAQEERRAHGSLSRFAPEVLLPLTKVRVRRWGQMVESIAPLFPTYLFALVDLELHYGYVRYARGVRGIVSFGAQPAVVSEWIISELKQRCSRGPVELPRRPLLPKQGVMIIDGLFREFEGIFERYLSGPERVAVLLSVMGCGARVVLPAGMVEPLA